MRLFAFATQLILASAVLTAAPVARAQTSPVTEPAREHATDSPSPDTKKAEPVTVDTLFADLRRESDPQKAKRISSDIVRRWTDSGSATANLLMQWSHKAIEEKKQALALDFLDQVTLLFPDYAEGWNRRATLHFMMGHFGKSMADINHVLALEPRHFGALSGMASIMEASEKDELALKAWEQVLTVYPANRQAQEKVGELADKLTGRRI
jgi:tetratricopeptide (TPR) repeat protein